MPDRPAAVRSGPPDDAALGDLLAPWPRIRPRTVVTAAALVACYLWGLWHTQVSLSVLAEGIPNILDFLRRLLPPTWRMVESPWYGPSGPMVPEIAIAIAETVQMAIVGTSFAAVLALPIALLAARNTSPHPWVYRATRLVLNLVRSVPEIILALVFVAAVGLGPFAGVLALTVGGLGVMSKQYAEAIEAIDPHQVMAVRATGANSVQTFVYGVIPQALPLVVSFSLLVFEANVRTATVLGIVGAGGVGFVLSKYMALFQYQHLMGALVLIVLAVTGIDRVSDAIRKRLT